LNSLNLGLGFTEVVGVDIFGKTFQKLSKNFPKTFQKLSAFFSGYLTFLTRNTGTFTIRIRDQTHTKEASTRSEARYVPRSKRVQKEVRELKKKSAKKYKK
jgi:hypothetical protein